MVKTVKRRLPKMNFATWCIVHAVAEGQVIDAIKTIYDSTVLLNCDDEGDGEPWPDEVGRLEKILRDLAELMSLDHEGELDFLYEDENEEGEEK